MTTGRGGAHGHQLADHGPAGPPRHRPTKIILVGGMRHVQEYRANWRLAALHARRLTTPSERPNGGVSVVSTLQMQNGIQYRVLGDPAPQYNATPIEPSLEDGYIWLMQRETA